VPLGGAGRGRRPRHAVAPLAQRPLTARVGPCLLVIEEGIERGVLGIDEFSPDDFGKQAGGVRIRPPNATAAR
jgi:hypothetical protein